MENLTDFISTIIFVSGSLTGFTILLQTLIDAAFGLFEKKRIVKEFEVKLDSKE